MNWNMNIRDLTKRQVVLLVMGIAAFCGVLVFLEAYKFTVTLALIALVAYFVGRGYLASKGD